MTFETAALQSSITKAELIAPDRGNAFDKAAGIVFEISPADEAAVLRSTNLDIYYLEWLTIVEAEGDHVIWRLPSRALASFIKSLPIGSGKTVKMTQNQSSIDFESGRTKAKLQMMRASDYIIWEPFAEEGMTNVSDLGSRIAQVEWAADRSVAALGIRFEPDFICATNGHRLAVAPLKIDNLVEGITVPPATLSAIIKPQGEAKLRVEGSQLLLMPDDHTQLRCVIIGDKYPPVARIMDRDRPQTVKFKKTEMLDVAKRALSISSDRTPRLRLFIGKEEIGVMVAESQTGHVGDILTVSGQAMHNRVEINFSPNYFVDALTNSPSEEIIMGYDISDTKKGKIYFNGGSGYEVWVVPLGDAKPQEDPE